MLTVKPMIRRNEGNGTISEDLYHIPEPLSSNFLELSNKMTGVKAHAKQGELSDNNPILISIIHFFGKLKIRIIL